MQSLFEKCNIGSITLKNRFVRAATWEGMATEQEGCTSRLQEFLSRIARGKVGLILTSHAYV